MDKRIRKNEDDNDLPKYVRRVRDLIRNRDGYRISNHPKCKDKVFMSIKITMEETMERAIAWRKKFAGKKFSDSAELLREDRER